MKAEDEGLELVGWNTARGHEAIDEQPVTDLERRAEELIARLRHVFSADNVDPEESAQVIEQLLSENRQAKHDPGMGCACEGCQVNFRRINEDLDRISAEREAYREALKRMTRTSAGYWVLDGEQCRDLARRILAENDR